MTEHLDLLKAIGATDEELEEVKDINLGYLLNKRLITHKFSLNSNPNHSELDKLLIELLEYETKIIEEDPYMLHYLGLEELADREVCDKLVSIVSELSSKDNKITMLAKAANDKTNLYKKIVNEYRDKIEIELNKLAQKVITGSEHLDLLKAIGATDEELEEVKKANLKSIDFEKCEECEISDIVPNDIRKLNLEWNEYLNNIRENDPYMMQNIFLENIDLEIKLTNLVNRMTKKDSNINTLFSKALDKTKIYNHKLVIYHNKRDELRQQKS